MAEDKEITDGTESEDGKTQEGGKMERPKNLLKEMGDEVKKGANMFMTVEPENVSMVADPSGWEVLKVYVDSGATENVLGEEMLCNVELKEGIQKKRNVTYEVANGVQIPNLGERTFAGVTSEKLVKSMTAQVCEVNKALFSVFKMVQAGNKVVFGDVDGSYIQDPDGNRIWLEESGGMYSMNVWVKGSGKAEELTDEDF